MTGKLSKNFHGVAIGPLSNILAVKYLYRLVNIVKERPHGGLRVHSILSRAIYLGGMQNRGAYQAYVNG